MGGGTIFWFDDLHRRVIQREISRVLVLNLLWRKKRCQKHRRDKFVLDTAFVLIDGATPDLGHGGLVREP